MLRNRDEEIVRLKERIAGLERDLKAAPSAAVSPPMPGPEVRSTPPSESNVVPLPVKEAGFYDVLASVNRGMCNPANRNPALASGPEYE